MSAGTILALDLGTKTGVARGVAGQRPALETWVMPAGGGAEVGPFMDAFEKRLSASLDGVSLLVFEAPFVGPKMLANMHVARRLIGLPALCEMVAHRFGVEVAECNIGTVKRDFAGHGRAEKWQMIQAAEARGYTPANDHEADALGCFVYTIACRHRGLAHLYDPIFAGGGARA